jgi:hypothetical protein
MHSGVEVGDRRCPRLALFEALIGSDLHGREVAMTVGGWSWSLRVNLGRVGAVLL